MLLIATVVQVRRPARGDNLKRRVSIEWWEEKNPIFGHSIEFENEELELGDQVSIDIKKIQKT